MSRESSQANRSREAQQEAEQTAARLAVALSSWEAVIGLEVHAQLRTRTKLFCACSTAFGAEPNSQVCPVCLGHPGVLPVPNREAVVLAVRMGLATGCAVRERSIWARKNYFYPDLPKNYQITQFDRPICEHGEVRFAVAAGPRSARLRRIHLEEDAGKSKHPEKAGETLSRIDLNRCGTPLIEIVSEPDLRGPEEAYAYLAALKEILEHTGVCDGNMEEGSLRCDANVSVRRRGETALGTRTELKNLNSFRFVEKAIIYEILRQIARLETGGTIEQETLLWEPALGRTRTMRSKEDAHDYRYFPEPDLPPLIVSPDWIAEIALALPELPEAKRARLRRAYGLGEGEVEILVRQPEVCDYFEQVVAGGGDSRLASVWVLTELVGHLNRLGRQITDSPVPVPEMVALLQRLAAGKLTGKLAKMALEEMVDTGSTAELVIQAHGWEVVSDDRAILQFIDAVIASNPAGVAEYRAGKDSNFRWLVGQVMKLSRGQVDPRRTEELLRQALADPDA
ncbi:MAG: Asp-tRNA(Asn)/Glu-tRNA(Gln) amidotransferase subunit GatB [Candidatus Eisenbacteria bacterium]|nr:Asp-tRNA(Asn)/Glu-tRNA(Gln) amidotransferase subunit GatB [Candidatus Eisenbacteria bacterium]